MTSKNRLPLFAFIGAGLFFVTLYLVCFPAGKQFVKYPQAANLYLSGGLPNERLLDFSPLYFYLHLLVQKIGAHGETVVWLQMGATAATAGLLALLLLQFYSYRIAVGGTIVFVLTRSVVVYSGVLEPEAFLLLCIVAFLFYSLQPRIRAKAIAGLALAFALALRPSVLPLLAAVPFFCLVNGGRKEWLRYSVVLLLPSITVLILLGLRNGQMTGSYSPVVMNPGFVFFEGSNPLSRGNSAVYPPLVGELRTELGDQPDNPHMTYRLIASREAGRQLDTAEANAFWRGKCWNYLVDSPGRFLRMIVVKTHYLLHSYRRHDLASAYLYDEQLHKSWIPAFPISFLAIPAIFGVIIVRHQWRRLLLIYTFFASQTAMMLFMYVSDRQRLALIPLFVFFAAAAVSSGGQLVKKNRIMLAGIILVAAGLLVVPSSTMRDNQHLWRSYEASDQAWLRTLELRERGAVREAARAAASGYAAAPWLTDYTRPAYLDFGPGGIAARALDEMPRESRYDSQLFDHAQILLAANRFDSAERVLKQLQSDGARFDRCFLQSSQPLYYLGLSAVRRGDRSQAILYFEQGLEEAPGDPYILAQLAALTGKEIYRQTIVRYFDDIDASFLVGVAQLELHDVNAAAANLMKAARLLPELWRIKLYVAVALAETGDTDQALRIAWAALEEREEPVLLEQWVVPMFAAAANSARGGVQHRYRYGMVLAIYGRLQESLRELQRAEAESGGTVPEIRRALFDVQALLANAEADTSIY